MDTGKIQIQGLKKNAIIIGAGPTGLMIASELAKAGMNVTVLEKTNKVGGMTASFKYQDFILDYGPHKFYTQLPGINEEFFNLVGENDILKIKKKNSINLFGKYFDFPVKMSQLLTKMPPSVAIKLFLDFVKANMNKIEVRSYEDYFMKGFGKTGYEVIFKGFAEKVWGDPKNLSAELGKKRSPAGSVFDVLKMLIVKADKDTSAEYFYYPKMGFGVICDRMAESIIKNKGKILFNAYPSNINLNGNKVKSIDIIQDKKKKRLHADYLISSIAITDLPAMLKPSPPEEIIVSSKKLRFKSVVISYIMLNKDIALKDNWLFFPERSFIFNRVAEQKSFSPFTAPKGKTILTAEVPCDFNDNLYNMPQEEMKERVIMDLVKANLIKKEEVIDFFTKKAGRVYPIYTIDYKENLINILAHLDKIDNLFTVGRLGLFNYNNIDHCMDMGKIISRLILDNKDRSEWVKARVYFDDYRIVD